MGNLGIFSGLGKLTALTEWTIEKGEWPSTVSKAVVGSTSKWTELAYTGSGLKLIKLADGSINLSPWQVGQIVKLPAAWVPDAPAAPPSGPTASSSSGATRTSVLMQHPADDEEEPKKPAAAAGLSKQSKWLIGGGVALGVVAIGIMLSGKKKPAEAA